MRQIRISDNDYKLIKNMVKKRRKENGEGKALVTISSLIREIVEKFKDIESKSDSTLIKNAQETSESDLKINDLLDHFSEGEQK